MEEARAKVIAALESGKYSHGKGFFYRYQTNCYCAVGAMLTELEVDCTENSYLESLAAKLGYELEAWWDFFDQVTSINDSSSDFGPVIKHLRKEWNVQPTAV